MRCATQQSQNNPPHPNPTLSSVRKTHFREVVTVKRGCSLFSSHWGWLKRNQWKDLGYLNFSLPLTWIMEISSQMNFALMLNWHCSITQIREEGWVREREKEARAAETCWWVACIPIVETTVGSTTGCWSWRLSVGHTAESSVVPHQCRKREEIVNLTHTS